MIEASPYPKVAIVPDIETIEGYDYNKQFAIAAKKGKTQKTDVVSFGYITNDLQEAYAEIFGLDRHYQYDFREINTGYVSPELTALDIATIGLSMAYRDQELLKYNKTIRELAEIKHGK